MTIEQWSDRIWLIKLGEEPALSEDLLSLLADLPAATPRPSVVIDLGAVEQINSSNLSQLLRVRKFCIDVDTKLYLTTPTDSVWAVFLTTGLDKVFHFMPDSGTALAQLKIDDQSS